MKLSKRMLLVGTAGATVGALVILGIRFFTYNPEQIHYHANFAVYLSGQREQFKGPQYYEEIAGSCAVGKDIKPPQRAHMHDNINDLVHVHDHAVTWGDFFINLRWGIGSDFIRTPEHIYLADDTHHITYLINGHAYDDISGVVIRDQDRMLIDYGNTPDATIQKEFASVAKTAHQYDIGKDPAACLGNKAPTWTDRLKHIL